MTDKIDIVLEINTRVLKKVLLNFALLFAGIMLKYLLTFLI